MATRLTIWLLAITFLSFTALEVKGTGVDKPWAPPALGIGDEDCNSWLARSKQGKTSQDIQEAWLYGFLSGYNYFASSKVGLLFHYDEHGLPGWIDRECEKHRDQKLAVTVDNMLRYMAKKP